MDHKPTTISDRYRNYFIPIGYMVLILISSLVPMDREVKGLEFVMKIDPELQNALHIPIFALLSYLWMRSFYNLEYSAGRGLVLSILCTAGFGFLNEVSQVFIPGRYFSAEDMFFNLAGLILGVLIGLYLLHGRKDRRIAQS